MVAITIAAVSFWLYMITGAQKRAKPRNGPEWPEETGPVEWVREERKD